MHRKYAFVLAYTQYFPTSTALQLYNACSVVLLKSVLKLVRISRAQIAWMPYNISDNNRTLYEISQGKLIFLLSATCPLWHSESKKKSFCFDLISKGKDSTSSSLSGHGIWQSLFLSFRDSQSARSYNVGSVFWLSFQIWKQEYTIKNNVIKTNKYILNDLCLFWQLHHYSITLELVWS